MKNSFKKIDKFKTHFLVWRTFWLFVVSVSVFYIFWRYSNLTVHGYIFGKGQFFVIELAAIAFIFVGLVNFILKPGREFKKQEIHNQPSWVFFLYWGIIFGSFIAAFIGYFSKGYGYWWPWLILALVVILLKLANERWRMMPDLEFKRFAAGAVGSDEDKLNFNPSAQNAAQGLSKLNDYVNVVGLYGGLGFGKSSYARMVLEKFNHKETLYTYISLTETNEAKDFSKLFAERWLETLSERYPKVDITSYLPFMHSILRESGNGFLAEILNVLSVLNSGLIRTKALFFDQFYNKKRPSFASSSVGKLFGNIPEIKEKLWIVMIDEIERGQFDEIYRLVEIIERFKNEGRSGLPTKLLFLLCISEPDFENYINAYEDVESRAHSLRTFFYEDPKSIVHRIFLPPVEPQLKQKFVIDLFNQLTKKEGVDVPDQITPTTIGNPAGSFMSKHSEAMGYIVGLLTDHSPRVSARTATALQFFYGSFRDRTGGLQKNAIRFSDILALEFIKIRYPYLIDFFVKTIHYLVAHTERNNLEGYLLREKFKKSKIDLIQWIKNVTGVKILDSEKDEVSRLVGLVMYYYFDFFQKDYDTKTKDQYFGTTSYPEIMHDYLSLVSESVETSFRRYSKIYLNHKKTTSKDFLSKLENNDLTGYARFLHDTPNVPLGLHINVINEFCKRFLNLQLKPSARSMGDTVFDEAVYQFIFQVLTAVEKDRSDDFPSEDLKHVFQAIKKVLLSKKINIGAKYTIINSFANNERGGGSSIHQRLESAFNELLRHYSAELKKIINAVFVDADKRYLSGNRPIYENEENFFYVLYQGWSGSKDAKEEIRKIRSAARRKLIDYPDALKLYWSRYPAKDDWRDLKDALIDDPFFSGREVNNSLYMPFETLLSVTKQSKIADKEIREKLSFWESVKHDPKVKELFLLKDDTTTLRAVLTRRGLLMSVDKLKKKNDNEVS